MSDSTGQFTARHVKEANRRFYDAAHAVYEAADGRRDERLGRYLDRRLERVAQQAPGRERFLDLGCGSGFLARRASGFFDDVAGCDLSSRILTRAKEHLPQGLLVAADVEALPFGDGTFDAVGAVAVLHHVLEHERLMAEAYRVLKPGGILYTDHDLERRFRNVFYLPLRVYRLFRDEERRYLEACGELDHQLYDATEVHREGLRIEFLERSVVEAGFRDYDFSYHWLGLSPFFDRVGSLLGPDGRCWRGLAPSISLLARKAGP